MSAAQLQISVVIPAWNCAHIIVKVLDALYQQFQQKPQFELVVINDFSQDNTGEILEQYKQNHLDLPLQIIHQTTVGSAARSRNCGLQHARTPLVLFLDADIVTETNVVAEHIAFHQQHLEPETVVLGQVASPVEWQETALDEVCNPSQIWQNLKAGEVDWSHFFTGHISAHKQFLLSVGGFDENYLRCEDVELGSRLKDKHMRLYYLPTAMGYHYHERSVAQEIRNNQVYAQMFAYFYKHGSPTMQSYVADSWFLEKNIKVILKRLLGHIFASSLMQPLVLALADKLSQHGRLLSQFIWRIVFFHIGYQSFKIALQESANLTLPKHPDHQPSISQD